jgi:long-chain acyl-CoA synthetase
MFYEENGIWIKTPTEEFILKAMLFLRYCYESVSKKDDKTVLILTSKRTEYSIIDIDSADGHTRCFHLP